jgi:hypothetical protein
MTVMQQWQRHVSAAALLHCAVAALLLLLLPLLYIFIVQGRQIFCQAQAVSVSRLHVQMHIEHVSAEA